jgi:porphyrinogen peroxidase
MSTPQTGIFALGTGSHAYLEFDLAQGGDPAALAAAIASMHEPRTTIGGVNLVCGFRPELWAGVAPDAVMPGVRGFNEPIIGAGGYTLPATQHDAVVWITGAGYDVVFDLSRVIRDSLVGTAALANEIVGWPYHHDRDLTGFIDGTENPSLNEATAVVVVPDGRPGAGSSILLLQQWSHDVSGWEALGVPAQEDIMGRRKADSEELSPKPPTSHVARTDQDTFGHIFRRNIGYGSLAEHGTIFSGFCADQEILEAMLRSMVGLDGSPADALTRFTRALTGAYYVIPSVDRLASLAAS